MIHYYQSIQGIVFIPKKPCSEIHGYSDLYIYLKQNPKIFIAVITFITSLSSVLLLGCCYVVGFHADTCYFVAGATGIVSNLYGFCRFRTLLNLKNEIDTYCTHNMKFAKENHMLSSQVNQLTKAKNELKSTSTLIGDSIARQQVNLGKFRELNINLKVAQKTNLELLGDINKMADKMKEKWKEELCLKERKILLLCLEKFEWKNDENYLIDGISQKQFIEFKLTLPMEYQLRLTRAGNWKIIAGENGILHYDQFVKLLDIFADEVGQIKHEKRMSTIYDFDANQLKTIIKEVKDDNY